MSYAWEAPRTSWIDFNGVGMADFNRIERNISILKTKEELDYIEGFQIDTYSVAQGPDGFVTVGAGRCMDETNTIAFELPSSYNKSTVAWSAGGAYQGMMAPGAASWASWLWWYLFAIYNPTTGDVDLQLDDNPVGTNISASGYTYKRRIACLKSIDAVVGTGFMACRSEGNKFWLGDNVNYRFDIVYMSSLSASTYTLYNESYGWVTPEIRCVCYFMPFLFAVPSLYSVWFWPREFGLDENIDSVEVRRNNASTNTMFKLNMDTSGIICGRPEGAFIRADLSIFCFEDIRTTETITRAPLAGNIQEVPWARDINSVQEQATATDGIQETPSA